MGKRERAAPAEGARWALHTDLEEMPVKQGTHLMLGDAEKGGAVLLLGQEKVPPPESWGRAGPDGTNTH